MGIVRAETIARIRKAIGEGLSQRAFERQERKAGRKIGRRTDVLADWRSEAGIKKKEDLLKYVRKDRYPTAKSIADVHYAFSKEFMYKVKVQQIIKAGEPITDRFVNIMSDVPMTPAMLEEEVREKWGEWEVSGAAEIVGLQAWSAMRKVME
ncbi:hypothetical protein ES703_81669 [subsurface metagenome]